MILENVVAPETLSSALDSKAPGRSYSKAIPWRKARLQTRKSLPPMQFLPKRRFRLITLARQFCGTNLPDPGPYFAFGKSISIIPMEATTKKQATVGPRIGKLRQTVFAKAPASVPSKSNHASDQSCFKAVPSHTSRNNKPHNDTNCIIHDAIHRRVHDLSKGQWVPAPVLTPEALANNPLTPRLIFENKIFHFPN